MEPSKLITEESARKLAEVRSLIESYKIESIKITTDSEAEGSIETVATLKEAKKELEKEMKPHYDKYVSIRDYFKDPIAKIDEITRAFSKAYTNYRAEKDRIAKEAQKLLDEQAAEAKRKETEKAEKAQEKADEYRAAGRYHLADKWEEKAQEKQESAQTISAPIVQPSYVKNVRGVMNTRKVYKARILNVKNVLVYFHKHGVPQDVVDACQKHFDALARASKGVGGIAKTVEYYAE